MSVKLVIKSSKTVSPRLERVLKKMSASAVTPARPYRAKEVRGTYVIYRPDVELASVSPDDGQKKVWLTPG